MQLSTGRKVIEHAEPNGSTFAEIEGGDAMTNAEWEEYCARIRALTLEQSRARLRNRIAPNFNDVSTISEYGLTQKLSNAVRVF